MPTIQDQLDKITGSTFPGAFIFVEDANGAIQYNTSGYGDLASQRRMKPDSCYRVGSTTKTFTAVVTLQYVQEEKLRLSDTMDQLLPDLPIPNASTLTIEHLLRMRSGLFDFEEDAALKNNLEAHLRPYDLAETVQMGIHHPATFQPGEKFQYCNTNFCLLEMIIEKTGGQKLAEVMQQRIFTPLGLVNTHYPAWDELNLPEPYIHGYERTQEGWSDCSKIFFGRGDGALVSTAHDLGRFFRALLLEQSLLTQTMWEKMMSIFPDDPPAGRAYGMGLHASAVSCGSVWGHSGGGYGYEHMPYLHLETGRFAIFMVNGSKHSQGEEDDPLGFKLSFDRLRNDIYCR